VKPDDQNLLKFKVNEHFTNDLEAAVKDADYIFFGTAHKNYMEGIEDILQKAGSLKGIVDACNLYKEAFFKPLNVPYVGIGRGKEAPSAEFVQFVYDGFRAMEDGLANEVNGLTQFLNDHFVTEDFNLIRFTEVQRLAASCNTGCVIADPRPVETVPEYQGFRSRLAVCAKKAFSPVQLILWQKKKLQEKYQG
jgi:hypothetical protein